MSPNPPRPPAPRLTVQQCWDLLPDEFAMSIAGDLGEALNFGGHRMLSKDALGSIVGELITIARAGDTGPLTAAQTRLFRILVWRWCADTASEGL
jgi:hypothetical protein